MQKNARTSVEHEALPNYFEIFGVIGDSSASPVGIGTFETTAKLLQGRNNIVRNTAYHFQRASSGSKEAVKRIENCSAGSAQKSVFFNQQRTRAIASSGDGRSRTTRSGSRDDHIELGAEKISEHLLHRAERVGQKLSS